MRKSICLVAVFLTFSFINQPLSSLAAQRWQIALGGATVDAEVVISAYDQQLGLGNRFSLPKDKGMLFLYKRPGERVFWMKRMNFPIDIIWLENKRIIHIEQNVQPPGPGTPDRKLRTYGEGIYADMVLEVVAGFSKKEKLSIGDRIVVKKRY